MLKQGTDKEILKLAKAPATVILPSYKQENLGSVPDGLSALM